MFDEQPTITSCTLKGVFLFQKKKMNQVGMTNSYTC